MPSQKAAKKGKKNATKKKSASRKKPKLKKKPMPPPKSPRSKGTSKPRSAQIHQGVGPVTITQPDMPEIPDDAAEYAGES
ncbi:MAG: hypothetical protein ABSA57_02150 [Candidatus Acidiferrales bacterium]|jgi:hypothetical protein